MAATALTSTALRQKKTRDLSDRKLKRSKVSLASATPPSNGTAANTASSGEPVASGSRRVPDALPPDMPAATLKRKRQKNKGKEKAKELEGGVEDTALRIDLDAGAEEVVDKDVLWHWTSLSDSTPSRISTLFTKDGRYFFCASGSAIRIYSNATGQVVSTLSAASSSNSGADTANTTSITSMLFHPHNAFQLITGSVDGHVRVWDFLEARLEQTLDLGSPILHICAHEKFHDQIFVAVERRSKPKKRLNDDFVNENAAVYQVSLKPHTSLQMPSFMNLIGKTKIVTGLLASPSGDWLVVSAGTKAYVASTSNIKAGFTKFVSPERLTCLAFHPSEEYFATGDEKGVIRLWYVLNGSLSWDKLGVEKRAQTSTLHWHAHAVSSIAFTTNGAYLLSGGEESVMVIWQLHTGKKEFVPRVGSAITTISVSSTCDQDEEYLLALADGTLAFISSSSLKMSRSYSRLKLDPAISYNRPFFPVPVPLAVKPSSSTVILPSSHPSSLQFFDLASNNLISELEIAPSNRISRKDDKFMEPYRVERVAISLNGFWMATVDGRPADDDCSGDVHLKFWYWDSSANDWILNTRIDQPHGYRMVTSLSFAPVSSDVLPLWVVTTGMDGQVKTWCLKHSKQKGGLTESFWVARSSARFRSEHPSSAVWSTDVSLLAVSFGSYIVLFDPRTNIIRETLLSSKLEKIVGLLFVGSENRHLVARGEDTIVVWDLLWSCELWYHHTEKTITHVLAHPARDVIILFELGNTQKPSTKVSFFRSSSNKSYRIRALPFQIVNVVSCVSTDAKATFSAVGLTHTWSVVAFGEDGNEPQNLAPGAVGLAGVDTPVVRRNLLHDIFGASAFDDVSSWESSEPPDTTRTWSSGTTLAVLEGPAYILPPLQSVFDDLMAGFLRPGATLSETLSEEHPADTGEVVEMDMDVPCKGTLPSAPRIVDDQEVEGLTDLFRQHALVLSGSKTHHLNGNLNGIHSSNGNNPLYSSMKQSNKLDVSDIVPTPSLLPSPPGSSFVDSPLSSSTPVPGKKRKYLVE